MIHCTWMYKHSMPDTLKGMAIFHGDPICLTSVISSTLNYTTNLEIFIVSKFMLMLLRDKKKLKAQQNFKIKQLEHFMLFKFCHLFMPKKAWKIIRSMRVKIGSSMV